MRAMHFPENVGNKLQRLDEPDLITDSFMAGTRNSQGNENNGLEHHSTLL
jgi:hypothetical protein